MNIFFLLLEKFFDFLTFIDKIFTQSGVIAYYKGL